MAFSKQQLMLLTLLVVAVASDELLTKKKVRCGRRKCSYNGKCLRNNQKVEKNCKTLRCVKGKMKEQLTGQKCSYNGKCLKNYAEVEKNCKTWRCVYGEMKEQLKDQKCKDKFGMCHAPGPHRFYNGGDEYCTCQRDKRGRPRVVCEGCECRDEWSGCHPLGYGFDNSTHHCKCELDWAGVPGLECERIVVVPDKTCHQYECTDDWGSCLPHGAEFPNQRDEHCRCRVYPGMVARTECSSYYCSAADCVDERGGCHKHGSSYSNSTNYCTCELDWRDNARLVCDTLVVPLKTCHQYECTDDWGSCHPPGAEFRNIHHQYCTCILDHRRRPRTECMVNEQSGSCSPLQCVDERGGCHALGSPYMNGTSHCICDIVYNDFEWQARLECETVVVTPQDTCQCQDSQGNAHTCGSYFPDTTDDGQWWPYCTCVTSTRKRCDDRKP